MSTRAWTEKDGVIYCSVTSDGKTGPEWVAHFEKKHACVHHVAEHLLCSSDFVPTTGITYQIAILKGMLWNDKTRVTRNIRSKAHRLQLVKSHAEIACLIRDKFTDAEIKAMGLFMITTMHKSIKDSDGDPCRLNAPRVDDGCWLGACPIYRDERWNRADGFAYVVS